MGISFVAESWRREGGRARFRPRNFTNSSTLRRSKISKLHPSTRVSNSRDLIFNRSIKSTVISFLNIYKIYQISVFHRSVTSLNLLYGQTKTFPNVPKIFVIEYNPV